MAEPEILNILYQIVCSYRLVSFLSVSLFNYISSENSLVVIWTTLSQNDSRQAHENFSFGYFSVVFA